MDDSTRTLPVLPRVQAGPDLDEALSALEQVQRVKAAAAALELRLLARVDALDDSGEVQWDKDGSTTWRSPTGRRYQKPVEPYLDPDPPPL